VQPQPRQVACSTVRSAAEEESSGTEEGRGERFGPS
jgi:hypothetical protein